jgi:hypothetical protein
MKANLSVLEVCVVNAFHMRASFCEIGKAEADTEGPEG